MATYDYIIVGAGSAGCVLANRLTADEHISVLLLEVGSVDTAQELYRTAFNRSCAVTSHLCELFGPA